MATPAYFTWAEMPETPMTPQIKRRLVSGDQVMVVRLTLEKGAVVSAHQHPHEQITCIISGALEFDMNGEKRRLRAGDVVCVPGNVLHGVVILEDTVTLEAFSPPREDFLSGGTVDYMK